MDIIDNYDRLSLGQYIEIQEIYRDEALEDIDKQVKTISVLTGTSEEDILHLPIGEYTALATKTAFLTPEGLRPRPVAKRYILGDFELIPVTDYRKLETCQYIDFRTFASDMDKYLVELLSVILVPKGHRYNEGYDVLDVQKAIREEMSVTDGVSLAGFFLTWCSRSIADSLNSCRREAVKIKDRAKREELMRRIAEQEAILSGTSGDGSPM